MSTIQAGGWGGGEGGGSLLQRGGEADLAGDVMGIEVEAADMLVDAGERVKALDGALSSLHHLALHSLGAPWNVLDPACLHLQACVIHKAACQRGQKGGHNNGIMHFSTMALRCMSALCTCKGAPSLHTIHPAPMLLGLITVVVVRE